MIREPDGWLGIDLRHLAALQAVAAEGAFHAAAHRLGYTQSAVSQQIATLERIVGVRLINRPGGPRAISLTEAGELLWRHAEAILARVRAAEADFIALAAGEAGMLRVGVYQSVGQHILPRLMRQFAASWPQIEIRLVESANDDELLPRIERGELDLTFAILPLPDGPFASVELLHDPYVLAVPAGSPLARRVLLSDLTEIADLSLIGFRRCRSVEHVEGYLRACGITPNIVFRSDDNGTICGLVAAGVGLALMPRLTIGPGGEGVVTVALSDDLPARRIALVWHRDRYRSQAAESFIAATQALCRELDQDFAARAS